MQYEKECDEKEKRTEDQMMGNAHGKSRVWKGEDKYRTFDCMLLIQIMILMQ